MSIAGGHHRAVERGHACGCQCVQLFTGNPRSFAGLSADSRQLSTKDSRGNCRQSVAEITADKAARFRAALQELGICHPIAHDCYLINLASPDKALWKLSIDAFVVELRRAETLGIPYVVAHPGAYTTSSERRGLRRIVQALNAIHAQTRGIQAKCLLETTAGQGTSLGWRFEHLASILDGVKEPDRLGVCFDTCHVFAAGYRLADPKQYRATMKEFDRSVGLGQIRAIHLNDSRGECGSRIDRHDHIGRGRMGLEPFRHLLGDSRFQDTPMYLETPKGEEHGIDLDKINLETLRGLAGAAGVMGRPG